MDIGIIGGADGPTTMYMASSLGFSFAFGAVMTLFISMVAYLTIKV